MASNTPTNMSTWRRRINNPNIAFVPSSLHTEERLGTPTGLRETNPTAPIISAQSTAVKTTRPYRHIWASDPTKHIARYALAEIQSDGTGLVDRPIGLAYNERVSPRDSATESAVLTGCIHCRGARW